MLKNFVIEVKVSKERFLNTLEQTDGPIVGYGATAKCTTVLNYCGIGKDTIEKIYDTTPMKQGLFIPGTDIQVVPYESFEKDNPKNVVLFAWNHAEEIFKKEKGKDINWIIPI
jgi:methylation protein EvaC